MSAMNFAAQLMQGGVYAQIAQYYVAVEGWRFMNRFIAGLGCALLALVCSMLVWHTPEEVGCVCDGIRKPPPAVKLVYEDEESKGGDGDDDEVRSEFILILLITLIDITK